ncbi:VOC family protein [Rhodococcus sp. NPDC003318]|uniref:VOC family protein n=1 Tax=Rhodococcus sp. NPDC003318 TaxID=3364503 RepID=UPI00367CA88D
MAYVCKDHEATRHFYEDVLGMPLIAAWAEVNEYPSFPGRKIEYLHAFYGLADGSTIAFFGYVDDDVYEWGRQQNGLAHIAMHVSREDQLELKAQLVAAGQEPLLIDHFYCVSLYSKDPDGTTVEFVSEPDNIDEIMQDQRQNAHQTLARWLGGDHTPNNKYMKIL